MEVLLDVHEETLCKGPTKAFLQHLQMHSSIQTENIDIAKMFSKNALLSFYFELFEQRPFVEYFCVTA